MRSVETALGVALEKVLVPLVRVLLRFHVSHSQFSEIVRRAYVRVGYTDFAVNGEAPTASRVAVVTGLSRKEVVRLAGDGQLQAIKPSNKPNRALRVITAWLTQPEFLDAQGNPKDLPFRGASGSFISLVRKYSGDITGRAVLDELRRVNAVETTGEKTIRLVRQAFIPARDESDKIDIMGTCVSDLLDTIGHNITQNPQDAYLQQQLIYHDIPEPVVAEFVALSREKSEHLMLELNRWLSAKKKSAASTETHTVDRVGLGIYYFQSPINKGRHHA